MIIKLITVFVVSLFSLILYAQEERNDTTARIKEKNKKGWNVGALPAIAFDSDLGFQYGIVSNVYNYGDGSIYPRYRHSIYLEWSRTTRGSGINQIRYDSEFLIPKIRVNSELSYFTDQAYCFYGFNGYNTPYISDYEDKNSSEYISKMFYRMDRKLAILKFDFEKGFIDRKLRCILGFTYFNNNIGRVNFNQLNKGRSESDKLKDTTLLYDNFVRWGVIPNSQKNGGVTNLIKAGVIYDTRDNEPNPMKGMWTELLLLTAPSFTNKQLAFSKFVVTHRQYFTLKKEVLNLAYRISYQAKIAGEIPFYMLPFVYSTTLNREGIGGAKTVRGILRNRAIGDDILYGNLELRWKFLRFMKFNQNFYLALAAFTDAGMVTGKHRFDDSNPDAQNYLKQGRTEKIHQSYGVGFYVAMNQNFVVCCNYGQALNPLDGNNGLYIGLDFLY